MGQQHNKQTLLKLLAVVPVTALIIFAQLQMGVVAQDQPGRLFEIVGMTVPLDQRFGVDDGAAFIVHFEGDTHGSLESCG